jgi:predicted metalloprotease with PDZ domain
MIRYSLATAQPHRHFIQFTAEFETHGRPRLTLQLPSWRPGRYELGNFAKNVLRWTATNEHGDALAFRKASKDQWIVETNDSSKVIIRYNYYAAELNAGSSFLDEDQLYVNPVNCFFYDADKPELPYRVELELPQDFRIACGLKQESANVLLAANFDELADCPFIASASMRRLEYHAQGITFHLWIQGEVKLDEPALLNEFAAFTKCQFDIFGDIPCKDYHFLFHFVPHFLRHGVEHANSTVIAMGPAADFQQDHLFKDLLGISCHELFHTWNVKNIRPVEMMPYDFTRENYSESGFVYEGVTTYYGDMLLWRSGAISDDEWLEMVSEHVQDHFNNHGRLNLSVSQSSWDTWLDGYVSGIPWRKVSIYNEGFLIALICDVLIMKANALQCSLDDVMRELYEQFGKKAIGYSKDDYRSLLSRYGKNGVEGVWNDLVEGTADYTPYLSDALSNVGVSLAVNASSKYAESTYGLSVDESNLKVVVTAIVPDSPADKAGLWYGDEILSVGEIAPYKNFQHLLRMQETTTKLAILRKGRRLNVELNADGQVWFKKYRCERISELTDEMRATWSTWKFGVPR